MPLHSLAGISAFFICHIDLLSLKYPPQIYGIPSAIDNETFMTAPKNRIPISFFYEIRYNNSAW
jgi:hypothetical protein